MAKTKRWLESLLRNVGVLSPFIVSLLGFAAIVAFWGSLAEWFGLGKLGIIERLAFGAALSWVMFLLTDLVKEVIGMLTLTSRRENWREEIAAEERAKARAEAMEFLASELAKDRAEKAAELAKDREERAAERAAERAKDREERAAERARDREIIMANQRTIRENQEVIRSLLQHLAEGRERKTDD